MSGSAVLALDLTSNTLKNLSCDASGNLIVNSSGSGGGGGDASAANQLTIISNQTNGSQNTNVVNTVNNKLEDISSSLEYNNSGVTRAVCVGMRARTNISDASSGVMIQADSLGRQNVNVLGNTESDGSGTPEFLHTDGNGNLNTQVINTLSVNGYRSSINSGATNQHALVNTAGYQYNKIYGNNSGSDVQLKCDANGVLETSGGGGGSVSQNTYSNATLSVLAPTAPATTKITTTSTFDLQNIDSINSITIYSTSSNYFDVSNAAIEYSYDNTNFFTNISSSSLSFSPALDINGVQRTDNGIPSGDPGAGNLVYVASMFPDVDKARYMRVAFLHNNNAGSNVDVVPIIVLNGK